MADADTDLVFVIDGANYPSPQIDSFDMAERRVMFDLSGIVEEDFVRLEDEDDDEYAARVRKTTRHPGFMESLMHIAYARGNPDLKRAKVQAVIDKTNYLVAIEQWADTEEEGDDDNPPSSEPTSERNGSSLRDSDGSNETSGIDSPGTSVRLVETRSPTGASK